MNFRPTHLAVTATDLASAQPGGRVVFLPGSTARAARIAEHFFDRRDHPSERGHTVHVGRLRSDAGPVDVASVSTGMGCPSLGTVVTELVELGLRRFVRVGSAGALQPEVAVGHVVIGSAAVRDEGASNAFAPLEFPAVASWRTTSALVEAAAACVPAEAVHLGVLHSKDSLHGREFGAGPMAEENRRYWQVLTALGSVASEMEASHLYVLAHALRSATPAPPGEAPIEAGSVCAVLAGVSGSSTGALRESAEARAIEVALEAARRLAGPR